MAGFCLGALTHGQAMSRCLVEAFCLREQMEHCFAAVPVERQDYLEPRRNRPLKHQFRGLQATLAIGWMQFTHRRIRPILTSQAVILAMGPA